MSTRIGRPSKIERFAEVAEQVLFNDERRVGPAIVHTDADLIEMINERLAPEERIADVTFRKWKGGDSVGDERRDVFLSIYKRALKIQRDSLFDSLADEPPGAWQKWAWILERKFGDWNLRNVTVDETPDVKKLVFVVESSPD
jgi:hypothetical protein